MSVFRLGGVVPIPVVRTPKFNDMRDQVKLLTEIPDHHGNNFDPQQQVMQLSTVRTVKELCGASTVFGSCMAHATEDNKPCGFKWRIAKAWPDLIKRYVPNSPASEAFVVHTHGDHAVNSSEKQKNFKKRTLKREISESGNPNAERTRIIESGVPENVIPSLSSVYKHTFDARRATRHPQTRGYEHFRELLRQYVKRDDMEKHQMWTLEEFIQEGWTAKNPAIPFTCDELIDQVVAYRARGINLKCVKDFTHDTCRQKWKLGVLGLLGLHEVKGEFCGTMIPIVFCLTPSESNHSYKMMLKFAIHVLRDKFDFVSSVSRTFADGHPGANQRKIFFPDADHHDCLEHGKKNIAKNGKKWEFKNKTKLLQRDMDFTAFIPNLFIFDLLWERIYFKLRNCDVNGELHSEDRMIRYLQDQHIYVDENNLLRGKWQNTFVPGYSVYSSNVVESFFGMLDSLEVENEDTRDIMQVFPCLERYVRKTMLDKPFQRVMHRPQGASWPPSALMAGDGIKVVMGGLHNSQFRRLTVERMINMTDIQWFIEMSLEDCTDETWDKAWILTYHPKAFDPERAEMFYNIVKSKSSEDAQETNSKDLRF